MSKLDETILRRKQFKQNQQRIKMTLDKIEQLDDTIEVDGFVRPYQSFHKSFSDTPYLIDVCLEPAKFLVSKTKKPSETKYNSIGKKIYIEYFLKVKLQHDIVVKGLGENEFNRCKTFNIDSTSSQIQECILLKNTEIKITVSLPTWNVKNIEITPYDIDCEIQFTTKNSIMYDIILNF